MKLFEAPWWFWKFLQKELNWLTRSLILQALKGTLSERAQQLLTLHLRSLIPANQGQIRLIDDMKHHGNSICHLRGTTGKYPGLCLSKNEQKFKRKHFRKNQRLHHVIYVAKI